MKITTFEDLIDKINSDLGSFCSKFAENRKTLKGSERTSNRNIFFKKSHPEWAINEGGGTEIQYKIDFHNKERILFGLGFSAQYVPHNNDCSPVDYIKPFVNAYFELKNTALVSSLKSNRYEFIIGSEEELRNIQVGQYYLFGKTIPITNNEISDKDYDEMIKDLQGDLFALYCNIFEKRNEILEKGNQMQEQSKKIEEFIALLKNSRNIILHGAPGTGKTYLARQIAESMGAETCFVQFHPSYDYTDFVEGLRPSPKKGNSDEIGFERMDGVFKKFCKKALISDNSEEVYKNFIEQLADSPKKYEAPSLGNQFEIQINGKDNIYAIPQTDTQSQISITKESLSTYLRTGLVVNWKPYITVLGEELRNLGYKKKNCVFIIDEINRGEMSKIFGELFFSIDPGYRGGKGKISTQYQNLVDEKDVFYDGFYVPENVYIIGTMNDIDRNVESMDFAIRRRFAFMEIEAEYTKESILANMPNKGKLIECMKNINNAIWNEKENKGIDGLSSAYHIGASYFLKYDSNSKDPVKDLWNYHLKPLLQEYLRGMEDEKGKLSKLEEVYNKVFKENKTETDKKKQ